MVINFLILSQKTRQDAVLYEANAETCEYAGSPISKYNEYWRQGTCKEASNGATFSQEDHVPKERYPSINC